MVVSYKMQLIRILLNKILPLRKNNREFFKILPELLPQNQLSIIDFHDLHSLYFAFGLHLNHFHFQLFSKLLKQQENVLFQNQASSIFLQPQHIIFISMISPELLYNFMRETNNSFVYFFDALKINYLVSYSIIYNTVNMKKVLIFGLLLALVLTEPITITKVQVAGDSVSTTFYGSIGGGTKISIAGTGFSSDFSLIQIYMGIYPCALEDGSTETYLSCFTSAYPYTTDSAAFPMRIVQDGTTTILKKDGVTYQFAYRNANTPKIYSVYPGTSIAGDYLQFTGYHRIVHSSQDVFDLQDVYDFRIGNELCDILGIAQNVVANSADNFRCQSALYQEGGRYNASQHVTPGYAVFYDSMYRSSLSHENLWQHVVLPVVNSATSSGFEDGQLVSISGSGFSEDQAKISVNVDGVDCPIVSSTISQIQCNLNPRSSAATEQIPTSSGGGQVLGFIGGSGFKYQKYDVSSLGTRTYQGLKDAVESSSAAITLLQESSKGELYTENSEANIGEVFKGYFLAPVSGDYIFRGAADDNFGLYISDDYGTATVNPTPYIYQDSYTNQRDNYFIGNVASVMGAPKAMEQGKYYYMELYAINGGGTGFVKISAEVPNSDKSLRNQRYERNHFEISFTNDPEIRKFTLNVEAPASGTFNLKVRTNPGQLIAKYEIVTLPYNATDTEFKNALLQFQISGSNLYKNYGISVTAEILDADGVTTTEDLATQFVWTVSIDQLRLADHIATYLITDLTNLVSAGSKSFTEEIVQEHCPLIRGSFSLQINGQSVIVDDTGIPAGVSAGSLQTAIRKLAGYESTEVYGYNSNCNYGCTYLITFNLFTDDIPDLVFSGAGLTGGKDGTQPQITFTETLKYSPNIIFNPVDQRFMFLAADTAQVQVTVNDVLGTCIGSCGYEFISNQPEITSQTLNGLVLTITINDVASHGFSLDVLTVKLGGAACQNLSGSFTSFTCDLTANSDGTTPKIEAGSYHTEIIVDSYGQIKIASGVNQIDFVFSITSASPSAVEETGGIVVEIAGAGFPLNAEDAVITLCGSTVAPHFTDNILTKIVTPSCSVGTETLTYTFGTFSDTVDITIDVKSSNYEITSISPTSSSPVHKGVMEISGNNFPTDAYRVKTSLVSSSGLTYDMKVLSSSANLIECGIPGGLAGVYQVIVNIDGTTNAFATPDTANDFEYKMTITGISPTTGSHYGGTLITITGENFPTDKLDAMVSAGHELNTLCIVEEVSQTQITCRTPETHPDWTSTTQEIIVNSKLLIDSTCSSTCDFTYKTAAEGLQLTTLSSASTSNGANLILTGLNFNSSPDIKVVFTNLYTSKQTVVDATSTTDTTATVVVPLIQGGQYEVRARLDPDGQSNGLTVKITTSFSPTSYSGSIHGGQIVLLGKGLPETWPPASWGYSLQSNGQALDLVVKSTAADKLVLQIPAGVDGQVYKISITNTLEATATATFTQALSSTPTLSLTSSQSINTGSSDISVTINTLTDKTPAKLFISNVLNPTNYQEQTMTVASSVITSTIDFSSGKYKVFVWYDSIGWAIVDEQITVTSSNTYTASPVDSSYAGGQFVLDTDQISTDAILKIGGFQGKVLDQSGGTTTFEIPPLVTPEVVAWYASLGKSTIIKPAAILNDGGLNPEKAVDGIHHTEYSSTNAQCYIGIDTGENRKVGITGIRFFPSTQWAFVAKFLPGAVIEASNDDVNYDTLHTVGSDVHTGWNAIHPTIATNYRYFRLRHDSTSGCKIAEFEVSGVFYNDISVSTDDTTVDVTINDGASSYSFASSVIYKKTATPVITDLDKKAGTTLGGDTLTFAGQNLGDLTILIDGIPCTVSSSTTTSAICQTGPRPTLPSENTFTVSLNGNVAISQHQFMYVHRWSDPDTWGTDNLPKQGDLVYVPQGMILYVDQSTPRLESIIVDGGKIIFADESDMEIHTGMILLRGGEFRAGTKDANYQHDLTFVLYGSYYGKQLPMFGNKFIGCFECKFSMWGLERDFTWSQLKNTVVAGATTFEVEDAVDWKVGEKVVVASTSFDHNEAEQVTIKSISGTVFTIEETFQYKHFSGVETFDSDSIRMKAEVGLLTRNIKMMGDETSEAGQYGSHLMMAGRAENGLVAHVGYSEFTHCGQPRIVGRYCIHYHMNGDVTESEVTGNAVHHSFARILTLHAIHYLRVKDNVGYRIKGHNFFIEDGIETHNTIQHNLVVGSLATFNMMQTDISVASYWVTNPLNNLINNRAAGGDFYGFWYEIKPHPDGPSSTSDICPTGNPLGASHDNVAHSYVRFGLRIFKYAARTKPCDPIRNDAIEDPWSQNPSIETKFYNYVTYKIGEAGLLAEETGNMIFQNFTIAESGMAGIQFYRTNLTKEPVIARDMAIIGVTTLNPPSDVSFLNGVRGAIGPRTSGWRMQNIRFHNFNDQMVILETCSKCDNILLYTNRAIEYFVKEISYNNVNASYLFQKGLKRSIVYDEDGTFTSEFDSNSRNTATIVPKYPHLSAETACLDATDSSLWDNALVCDDTVLIRAVTITNALPHFSFKNIGIKVKKISALDDAPLAEDATDYSEFKSLQGTMEPMDKPFAWSMPYVAGSIYNVWWLTGIDFEHIAIEYTSTFQDGDPAVLFRFNYTEQREIFEIGDLVNRRIVGDLRTVTSNVLDADLCNLGDYNNDVDNRLLKLCITPRNSVQEFQYLDVNGIRCRFLCPSPTGEFIKENFVRMWSNATQWPDGVMPSAGDNVSIHGNWTIIMDVQPADMGFFYIDGDVIIPETLSPHIVAQSIWIRAGSIKAGNSSVPHPGTVQFEITGNKNDVGFVINEQIAGTKLFVVHGILDLYGRAPSTKWTKLKATAAAGATEISVLANTDWQVGDEIVIGPSYSDASQHEKVEITEIVGSIVRFTPALQHSHYGAVGVTIDNDYGTLDTRTAVGHLTRSIKIFSGADSGWGFRFIVNSFLDGEIQRYGKATIKGVEFNEGGQYDTQYSAVSLKSATDAVLLNNAFHNCKSYCLDVSNTFGADVENNVFYLGRISHARVLQTVDFVFKNNLMIAAIKRPTTNANDLIACYASWDKVEESVVVQNNLCQGSDLHGFALGFSECSDTFYPYSENTVGSAAVGFIFNKVTGNCMWAKGLRAYACGIGQISSPPSTQTIIFEDFIIADSGRAVTLRFGKQGDNRTAYFRDSYITAISRPDCSQCYGDGLTDCSGNQAIRMLAVTVNGQMMPSKFGGGFDVICKQEAYDSKAMLDNITFDGFKLTYSTLSQCSNNILFRSHPAASDITGSHNLRDCTLTNSDFNAIAQFDPPNPKGLGWSGGCGSILCTGKNNYLIHDYTGGVFGKPGILIANNSQIGDNSQNCTFIQSMNGYYCDRQDFGVIEYESIAPDFNTRIMWPVYLKYDGGAWNTSTNGWREWSWEGNQPLNKRLGRFVSIVELSQIYNMTFESEPPIDIRFQFQRRSTEGNNSEYIVIKMHYPRPNSIRVQNKGVTIKPITLRDAEVQGEEIDTTVCGSNKFFYENYTVHFVLTAASDCQVRVSLTNSIQLTARFNMNIDDFFANDGQTKFINRICAALGITDYSRVKVVGVYNGSVMVKAVIEEEATSIEDAATHDNTASAASMTALQATLTSLLDSGSLASDFSDFGQILEFDSEVYDHPEPVDPTDPTDPTNPPTINDDDDDDDKNNGLPVNAGEIGLIVGVSVGSITVIAAIFAVVIYIIRKRAKVEELRDMDSENNKMAMYQNPSSVFNFAQNN